MMKAILAVAVLATLTTPALAELPEFYKSVDRLIWVVEDVDQTVQALRNLGFTNLRELGEIAIPDAEFRGQASSGTVKAAVGRLGDVLTYWFQPLDGWNAYSEFLKVHGSGVFSLMHRAPTKEAFDAEVNRMKSLGAGVLMEGVIAGGEYSIDWAFFDTGKEGKYVLGLLHTAGTTEFPLDNPSGRKVTQFAFAVRELEPVSEYWASLGFPPMQFTHGKLTDLKYRGKPANFDMRLGWQRHGKVVYEWIQSLQGPDVYLDHMKVHGEGFHHLAFNVTDIDADIAWWTEKGYPESMSGGWGEKGKPGSGRFTYVDSQSIGGTDIELLWSYKGE